MGELQPHALVAFNTATASTNKIHDDEVARRFGFRAGLVPGVDVYAYLTHPPVAAWGRAWLESGTMQARFHQPVYDGDEVRIEVTNPTDGSLRLLDPSGAVCAEATATPPGSAPAPPNPADWPLFPERDDPPPASPETLVPGTAFGLDTHLFDAEQAGEYLDAVREDAPLYRIDRIAHPGWVLRDANYVLSHNVALGPWIHVESRVTHHSTVANGEELSTRAVVTEEWERKGHRFVRLDVLHLAGDRPVARTDHVAIYRPRGA